uniref:Uncharacterized protein n=1 Tax=Medicago truncatula TaxID=3880 RepID=I3S934_MEDTR|nr:unknown [Medicago truncatula]
MADEAQIDVKEEVPDIAPFDPTKKKKKKKPAAVDLDDDSVDKLAEKTENLSVSEGFDSILAGSKKKKKKPVEISSLIDESDAKNEDLDDHAEEDEGDAVSLQPRYPWEGSDRDYQYEELLGRVFNILRENNPELAGDRRRTVMRPPQVLREGTKKTVFCEFYGPMQNDASAARSCHDFLACGVGYKWFSRWTAEIGCEGKVCTKELRRNFASIYQ